MERLLLATPDLVRERLQDPGMDLDDARIEALIEEASLQVEGYLGYLPDPLPRAVSVVVARMVARVLEAPTDGFMTQNVAYNAGPYSVSTRYAQGASGGSPWMNQVDRRALARFRRRGRITTVGIA